MSRGRPCRAALGFLLGIALSGCALFKSPDANDLPKSKWDPSDDDVANGTDPNQQKPLIDPSNFSTANMRREFKKLMGRGPDRNIARQKYDEGAKLYEAAGQLEGYARQQKFVEAAKLFVEAADRWPDTSLEQDALFMAGDAYFFADHYVEANRQYELLVKKHPNSRHLEVVEARRFIIAKYWLVANEKAPYYTLFNLTDPERPWFDTRGNALRVYDRIRVDDPTGKLADDATMAHAIARFEKSEWEKADELFTDLVTAFPDSEHQFNAHYLGLKAKLNSYRGSDYEGSSLDEADKLIKQMRRMFPREANEERTFLDRSAAEIRYKKAERIWNSAAYYDYRGEAGAAKHYYAMVVREYDDTPFAKRAEQRIAALANQPDVPPQRLKWLVKLFPESDPLRPVLDKALIKPGDEEPVQQANVAVETMPRR
jgi:outer membrane protein assembly factor BamD (BamD/ComL family)